MIKQLALAALLAISTQAQSSNEITCWWFPNGCEGPYDEDHVWTPVWNFYTPYEAELCFAYNFAFSRQCEFVWRDYYDFQANTVCKPENSPQTEGCQYYDVWNSCAFAKNNGIETCVVVDTSALTFRGSPNEAEPEAYREAREWNASGQLPRKEPWNEVEESKEEEPEEPAEEPEEEPEEECEEKLSEALQSWFGVTCWDELSQGKQDLITQVDEFCQWNPDYFTCEMDNPYEGHCYEFENEDLCFYLWYDDEPVDESEAEVDDDSWMYDSTTTTDVDYEYDDQAYQEPVEPMTDAEIWTIVGVVVFILIAMLVAYLYEEDDCYYCYGIEFFNNLHDNVLDKLNFDI